MKVVLNRIWTEPVVLFQIPAVVFGIAAGVWTEPWLGFAAAACSGVGAIFARSGVAPIKNGR
jgi:hypothetical protein